MGKQFICMFGGEAGYGVMSAGSLVAKGAGRNGLWSLVVNEYPSLIKGGLNTSLVRLTGELATAYEERLDFLGALSQPAFDLHIGEVAQGGIAVYDAGAVKVDPLKVPEGIKLCPVQLVRALPGDSAKVMANSALLGAFCAVTGYPAAILKAVMADEFGNAALLEKNYQTFDDVYEAATGAFGRPPEFPLAFAGRTDDKMLINGNEAIALGAIKAGCKFAAGYPMTPGSSVLAFLAEHGPAYNLVFKQTEDELAAINMLIGAGYAGVRALGATSGGGFALMTEALGFAGQAEVPVVLVEAQRGGPSTGLPTRTAQGDLNFVAYASQGEFPRFIAAPGDVAECFYETFRMFNLVEKYQVPGIILTDKYLADTSVSQPFFSDDNLTIDRGKLADEAFLSRTRPYLRYRQTDDGVSPRAVPGQAGGRHIATSYTHGEDGFYSSGNREYAADEPEVTAAGLDKWYRKVPLMEQEVPGIRVHGPEEAEITVIAWGSTKGAVLEAMTLAAAEGIAVNFIQVLYVAPFPVAALDAALAKVKKTLLVEGNKTAQLGGMIRAHTGYRPDSVYLKYDSRPFVPSAILAKIKEARG
ncbi:MAG TPA: 2-oxoacid:acceptor oxidoreductase subunit alpha [Selenomonadales bacterium]|nr:2-oxoacid:acceptor oxidoreductase subunit alpha [Selenomonadales bacterium]